MYYHEIKDFKLIDPPVIRLPRRKRIPNPNGRGYIPYTVDEFGLQVYSLINNKVLTPSNRTGRTETSKSTDYKKYSIAGTTLRIHQLVAMTFYNHVPNGNTPLSDCIDHIDGNPKNNQMNNLEIVSMRMNAIRYHMNGTNPYGVGIRRYKNRYGVEISNKSFGRYDTVEEAQLVHREKLIELEIQNLKEKSYILNEMIEQVILDISNHYMKIEFNPAFLLNVDCNRLTLTEEIRGFGREYKTRFDDYTVEYIKRRLNTLIWNRKI